MDNKPVPRHLHFQISPSWCERRKEDGGGGGGGGVPYEKKKTGRMKKQLI